MILADKIILLRKKNGWSQEALAEKMNVSRQAVSKWEAAQTTPDLEKILMLGELFGVTTDYLLKDEMEAEEAAEDSPDSICRSIAMEEANAYLEHRKWASGKIALATVLCILSPIALLMLIAVSSFADMGIAQSAAVLAGLVILILLVAAAVAIFLGVEAKNRPYKFLQEERFELAYGVSGMVREKQKRFHPVYVRGNITGVCLCIAAPVILLIGAFTNDAMAVLSAVSATIAVVGVGVWQFISVGVKWAAMERLLQEGEYSEKGKKKARITEPLGTAYWMLATAVYLGWSFVTNDWKSTWVVWPVAGVLYAAVMIIVDMIADRDGR